MAKRQLLVLLPKHLHQYISQGATPRLAESFDVCVGQDPEEVTGALKEGGEFAFATMFCSQQAIEQVLDSATERSAKCTWIHSLTAGVEALQSDKVKGLQCPVTNAKGVFSSSLAEFALFGCLFFNKQYPRLKENQKAKLWDQFPMGELRGRTMGVIGYGDIGSAIGRLAMAFGMKVWASKRTPPPGGVDANGVKIVDDKFESREALLAETDFLASALPGTPQTLKSVGERDFGALKDSAVFVNVGRGATVDEEALVRALEGKAIAAAALDVFAVEPLPKESPLWEMENVLLTPHNADRTEEYYASTVDKMTDWAKEYYLESKAFPDTVNLDVGY